MKSIIAELFNEPVSRAELIRPQSDEYKAVSRKKETAGDKFLETLSKEQFTLFESFLEAYHEVQIFDEEAVFKHGVSLGVRLTAESFLLSKENIT